MGLALLTPLSAQTGRPQPCALQSWSGQSLFTPESPVPSQARARLEAPGKRPRTILLPSGTMDSHFLEGTIYVLAKDLDGKRFRFLKSGQGETWESLGTLAFADILPAIPLQFLPLGNGRLLVRTYLPLHLRGRNSLLGIFRPGTKEKLELDDLVLDEAMEGLLETVNRTDADGKARTFGGFRPPFRTVLMLPQAFQLVATREACIFVNAHLGRLLTLDRQDGRKLRARDVFGYGEAKAIQSSEEFEHCLLGVQPTADGHLLLATRSEDAFLNARKIFAPRALTPLELAAFREKRSESLSAFMDSQKHARSESLKAFPDVFYWDFDPLTGDLIRQPTPSGLPGRLLGSELLSSFSIQFKADGRPALPSRSVGSL
jgi:hypothetical protein